MKSVELGFNGAFQSLRRGTGLRNRVSCCCCCCCCCLSVGCRYHSRFSVAFIGISVGLWKRQHVVALACFERVLFAEGRRCSEVQAGTGRLGESGHGGRTGLRFGGKELPSNVGYADAVCAAQSACSGPNRGDLRFEHLLFRGRRGWTRWNQARDVLVIRRQRAADVRDARIRATAGRFARNNCIHRCPVCQLLHKRTVCVAAAASNFRKQGAIHATGVQLWGNAAVGQLSDLTRLRSIHPQRRRAESATMLCKSPRFTIRSLLETGANSCRPLFTSQLLFLG